MPKTKAKKKKNKSHIKKYLAVLEKFGILPLFDFSDSEKKIVKYLAKEGAVDFLSFCDHFEFQPEKGHKVINKLVAKNAVEFENDQVSLTLPALNYLHTEKKERKSAKKFYKFVDALSEKELDEFMKLVSFFVVSPDAGKKKEEEPVKEEKPVEEAPAVVEAPKPAPAKKAPARKPATGAKRGPKPKAKIEE